jgi:outer membrane protein assembly factor BamB
VLCGDNSEKVTMLDAESGKMVWETKLGDRVFSVDFSSTVELS